MREYRSTSEPRFSTFLSLPWLKSCNDSSHWLRLESPFLWLNLDSSHLHDLTWTWVIASMTRLGLESVTGLTLLEFFQLATFIFTVHCLRLKSLKPGSSDIVPILRKSGKIKGQLNSTLLYIYQYPQNNLSGSVRSVVWFDYANLQLEWTVFKFSIRYGSL